MTKSGLVHFLLYVFTLTQSLLITLVIVRSASSFELLYFIMLFGTLESIYLTMYLAREFERVMVWDVENRALSRLCSTLSSLHNIMLLAFSIVWGLHAYGYHMENKIFFFSTMFSAIYFVVMVNMVALVSMDVFRTMSKNREGEKHF